MAQLNARMTDEQADAIRALAEAEGVGIGTLVVRRVLGDQPSEPVKLRPDQIERLDQLQALVADATGRLTSLEAEVEALRASDPMDQIAALDRRLSDLIERAERSY